MTNSTEQSKAHRLFFAKATHRGVFDLKYSDYWDAKLGESGADVLRRFIAEGLIAPAPIKVAIDKLFTAEQLKPRLKERGLKVGGKKFELIERILAADPAWAEGQTKNGELYYRTPEGYLLADEIYTSIGTESGEMEGQLLGLIYDGKYEEAFRTWAAWDEDQVFPRDAWQGIDNRKTDPSTFVQMARSIATKLPTGEGARAIINVLYGNASYDPQELKARNGATYERDLIEWREMGSVVGIQIKPSHNIHNPDFECRSAKIYTGCFRLEDAPDYPFGKCAYEMDESFCNCGWYPVYEDQPEGGWKIPEKRHPMAGPPARRQAIQATTDENKSALAITAEVSPAENANSDVIPMQTTSADSNQDDSVELPIGFARRVMENKSFGVAFVVMLLIVAALML